MLELTPSQIRAKMDKLFPVRFKQDPKMTYYFNNAQNDEYGFFKDKNDVTRKKSFEDVISINGKEVKIKSPLSELKKLIREEIEDLKNSEPLTFEGNPLEFILNKYSSLNDTMVDLLTPSFRDYVTGIFIVAPKPTTFRILLHNNQEYYLICAPDGYVAKIAGKKYDLRNLSEEEYAINSIAQLLELGMPPAAEGPNAEVDNQADLQGDMGSEVSSLETPPEGEAPVETPSAPPAPTEETPPENLQESKLPLKIKLILKK
jgi:hypothetical protein